MPTVDAFAEEMAEEFGENYADADTAEQFQEWVSEVVNEIYAAGRWSFASDTDSLSLVASTRTYSLDTDTVEVTAVTRSGGNEITYVPLERLIARGYDILSEDTTPLHWYYAGIGSSQEREIGFYPVPDGSLSVTAYVFIRPGALGTADDIPLPYEFLQAVRHGVRSRLKANDGDLQGAQMHEQKFQQIMTLLQQRLHGNPRGPSRLPVKRLPQIHQAPASTAGS